MNQSSSDAAWEVLEEGMRAMRPGLSYVRATPLSFNDVHEAARLIEDRGRIEHQLRQEHCGLLGVGPYRDKDIVKAVEPSYRAALLARAETINARLREIGVDPDHADNVDAASAAGMAGLKAALG